MPARRQVPLWFLLPALALAADPPAIRREGVVNAASQRPASVGGAVARGTRISIHGVHFGSAARVLLESGGRPRPLAVLHADAQRLDAWIPPDAPLGEARLTVISGGLAGAPQSVTIRHSAPGLFSANGEGWGPARVTVDPGGRLTLEATGIAPTDRPEVLVGNARARVLSVRAATAPDYIAKIAIQLPSDAPEGCFVPVFARLPGAPPGNTVTIAVHRGGGPCVSAAEDPAAGWEGGKSAVLALARSVRHTRDEPEGRIEDEVDAAFFDVPAGRARASPLLSLPPPGTCSTWAGALEAGSPLGSSLWTLLFGGIGGVGLDAGAWIAIRSQAVQLRIPPVDGAPGLYRRSLPRHGRLSLDSGRLGMAGPGGAQVGPFAVSLLAPVAFAVPAAPPEVVDRAHGIVMHWAPGNSAGNLLLVLVGADANRNVAGMTYCTAPQASGSFAIAADRLAQLPAGPGRLTLASWQAGALNPAPSGIARMAGLSVFAQSWELEIR